MPPEDISSHSGVMRRELPRLRGASRRRGLLFCDVGDILAVWSFLHFQVCPPSAFFDFHRERERAPVVDVIWGGDGFFNAKKLNKSGWGPPQELLPPFPALLPPSLAQLPPSPSIL